jgi:hypothetical protein
MNKPAIELISPNRLDVFTKTSLARGMFRKKIVDWDRTVYREYLKKIEPKEGFSEDGLKFTLEDYESSFESLFESINKDGFNAKFGAVPVGTQGITNGAHRLAICLAMGINIDISDSSENDHNYDYQFMKSIGFESEFLDFTVSEYLLYSKNVKIICLMGINSKIANNILSEIHSVTSVLFAKEFQVTRIGGRRIIEILYGHNDWWTEELFENLYLERFSDVDSNMTCIFLDEQDNEKVVDIKNRIRSRYSGDIYPKKIHSTDNFQETKVLSQTVLSKSALHFINHSPLGSGNRILELINDFFREFPDLDKEDFVFDSGTVLDIYGLRQAKDVDFITVSNESFDLKRHKDVDCHNSEYVKFPISINDLIFNPINYFYHNGFKFMDLRVVTLFKSLRGEPKDADDLKLIQNIESRSIIYSSSKNQGKALKRRRKLIIRTFVDRVLLFFPTPISHRVRNLYKFLRSIFLKVIGVKKNYL